MTRACSFFKGLSTGYWAIVMLDEHDDDLDMRASDNLDGA